MAQETQYYELSYLLKPTLGEEEIKEFKNELKIAIEERNGIVESSDNAQKRKLAYEMNNFHEAHFGVMRFTIFPHTVEGLQELLLSKEHLIRHMVVKWQRHELKKPPAPKPTYTPKKEEKEKTTIETIDKKLDEILQDEI